MISLGYIIQKSLILRPEFDKFLTNSHSQESNRGQHTGNIERSNQESKSSNHHQQFSKKNKNKKRVTIIIKPKIKFYEIMTWILNNQRVKRRKKKKKLKQPCT